MKEDEILLRDILDDHSRNPNGVSRLANPSFSQKWVSQKTGNSCLLEIIHEDGKIKQLSAHIEGSALAKACASIMCGELINLTRQDASNIKNLVFTWIEEGVSPSNWPGDLIVYQSLSRFPDRLNCAKLCWNALGLFLED